MNTKLLRILWSAVHELPTQLIVSSDDSALSQHLLSQIETQNHLSCEETCAVSSYIATRTPLIRDLAYS